MRKLLISTFVALAMMPAVFSVNAAETATLGVKGIMQFQHVMFHLAMQQLTSGEYLKQIYLIALMESWGHP
ncbi:hypothetical protein [Hafnia psychrotolerans]|uniref:Uncharacterized protein n=1 Tax=Hafnia psychrotolerans TaxID=1477018 RepID=A0ABQ1H271_9GAMM|nr:hypothetical protein [Hafnia psychrotolerans]GGA55271.1 hypothetical protein GCM10011328_33470 [Hafnia psychrotolerans]